LKTIPVIPQNNDYLASIYKMKKHGKNYNSDIKYNKLKTIKLSNTSGENVV